MVSELAGGSIEGVGRAASFPERKPKPRARKREEKPESEPEEVPADETSQDDADCDAEPELHIDIHVAPVSDLAPETFQIETLVLQVGTGLRGGGADRPCESVVPA